MRYCVQAAIAADAADDAADDQKIARLEVSLISDWVRVRLEDRHALDPNRGSLGAAFGLGGAPRGGRGGGGGSVCPARTSHCNAFQPLPSGGASGN